MFDDQIACAGVLPGSLSDRNHHFGLRPQNVTTMSGLDPFPHIYRPADRPPLVNEHFCRLQSESWQEMHVDR